jgi:hypothetical protein
LEPAIDTGSRPTVTVLVFTGGLAPVTVSVTVYVPGAA